MSRSRSDLQRQILDKILDDFAPRVGRGDRKRLDWFHAKCNSCRFHWPMWHSDTHKDPTCPSCGGRDWTQAEPNHPEWGIWRQHLEGYDVEARRKAEDYKRRLAFAKARGY